MHINTKVVFEWDDKAQEYRETSSEGYEYDGEMMLMQGTDAFIGPPDPNSGGQNWLQGLLGGIAGAGRWGGNQLQKQLALDSGAEGNWLDPALNIFGNYMQQGQGAPEYTSPGELRSTMMKGMRPTLGAYEDIGQMAYGGGPIMDAARQQMRGGLHDASAQASNQMNAQLAQRGVGGLGDILNRKNLSQMTEQMRKGETDLTRYGVEAGLKGLEGTSDIRGGINTAVANLKQYNQNQRNYQQAQQAAGSSAMYSGLLRGGLNILGGLFE